MAVELNREFFEKLRDSIENRESDAAISLLEEMHPADIAEFFEEINIEDAKFLFLLLKPAVAANVIIEIEDEEREKLLESIPNEIIAEQLIEQMDSDDAADILGYLDDERSEEILSHIKDLEQAGDIVDLLNYDEDTAGGIMAKELVAINENLTVKQALGEMRDQAEDIDEIYYLYVVDDKNILKGTIALKDLLFSSTNKKISSIYSPDVISVKPDVDSEEVAQIMEKYDLVALPVVDGIGRLMGRITIDDVVDVIREEAEEDYQLMSGITQDVDFSDSVVRQSRSRIPWLVIGMVGGIAGSLILGLFEADIEKYAVLALFLPLIVATGGNAGVQSSAIVVQGLASGDIDLHSIWRKLWKEFKVGLVNGLVCAAIIFLYNLIFSSNFALTLTVSLSLLSVIMFATVFGTFIPLMLNKMKIDPAIATGPFITTSNDIIGIFIYLIIARGVFAYFV
ncbi:MAG: magnesium transporter [Bacteroidales bacterium]|nr:magnesium transporter [Bacteroidales bacterium]